MDLRVLQPSSKRHRGSRTRDQPPTRGARRNGSRWRARAREGGLLRRDSPHQSSTGKEWPATKNPRREAMQVGVLGVTIAFSGGDGARVHLRDCPGGGLCRAARCRGCPTHSRPQVTSAGRNLITVFSAVNNLSQKNSRARPPRSPPPGARHARCARVARRRNAPKTSRRIRRRTKKLRVLCGLRRSTAPTRPRSRTCGAACVRPRRARRRASGAAATERHHGSADGASQQPDCAKVRKKFRSPRDATTRARRAPRGWKHPRLSSARTSLAHPIAAATSPPGHWRRRAARRTDTAAARLRRAFAGRKRNRPHRAAGRSARGGCRAQWSSSSSSSA